MLRTWEGIGDTEDENLRKVNINRTSVLNEEDCLHVCHGCAKPVLVGKPSCSRQSQHQHVGPMPQPSHPSVSPHASTRKENNAKAGIDFTGTADRCLALQRRMDSCTKP
jgi:hypothetical protein